MALMARVYRLLEVVALRPVDFRRRVEQDATLRQLCEEYEVCLDAIAHWSSGPVPNLVRVVEYRRLASDLEGEATRRIHAEMPSQ